MNENENLTTEPIEEEQPKKRRGRRPKAESGDVPAAKPQTVYVQYPEVEVEVDELLERARAAFREEKKRTPIKELKLYIKTDERAAYYVINEKFNGKLDF